MGMISISPLSLDQLTRDYWGAFDPYAIAQLAPLANDPCYQPKIYKAPSIAEEVMPAGEYVAYGLKITPGSIIWGIFNPPVVATGLPIPYDIQITDQDMQMKFWAEPVPSALIGNSKPTYQSQGPPNFGSMANILTHPRPVVGDGLFLVEIYNNSNAQERIEFLLGVLENVEDLRQ